MRKRGFTLAEVLVASAAMGILTMVCFAIYAVGLKSWTKVDAKTEVLSTIQLLKSKISRELMATQQPSVSIPTDSSGLAFLSAGPENSRTVDAGARPEWQTFVYFYHNLTEKIVYRKEVPYSTTDVTLMTTLEAFTGDTLIDLKTGGQPKAHNITKLDARLESPNILNLLIQAEIGKEKFELKSTYLLNPES